ncbi:MAG: hypothetical protein ABIZ36_10385 [Gemmatimonadaceae bacterium]
MIENHMTCGECDEMFLDYFEATLDAQSFSRFNEHTSTCLRCQALIRDVTGIREHAAALLDFAPSRELWSGIEARIQPEVRAIAPRSSAESSRRWLVAAAAALIVVTSGVTYVATSRSITRQPGTASVAPTIVAPPRVAIAPVPAATPPAIESSVADVTPRVSAGSKSKIPTFVPRSAPRAALASSAPPTESELAFSGEINQLQSVLVERRAQLDPETVKVVEDNLKLIDTAVRHARSALLKDPASGFLTRQLDNALQKKVELLRTVALMPSST